MIQAPLFENGEVRIILFDPEKPLWAQEVKVLDSKDDEKASLSQKP